VTSSLPPAKFRFGIVRGADFVGLSTLRKLCEAAGSALGMPVEATLVPDHRSLAEDLAGGHVAFGWLSPLFALTLLDRELANPLAIPVRKGQIAYHSALITKKGGPKTLAELGGTRAAWVDQDSVAGYVVPRTHLAAAGHDVRRFFGRETFHHGHRAVVDAVARGEADVGATYCQLGDDGQVVGGAWYDANGERTRPIKVLTTMGPIPNDALLAAVKVPASVRVTLTRFLLTPPKEVQTLLEGVFDSSQFRVADATHYEPLGHILRTARARGYDALPSDSRTAIRIR
jgi:ABC-type phosphate/phosphonate transport system substrate-binding protein